MSLKLHMMYEHGPQSSKDNSRLILVVQIVFMCVYFVSISTALDIAVLFLLGMRASMNNLARLWQHDCCLHWHQSSWPKES